MLCTAWSVCTSVLVYSLSRTLLYFLSLDYLVTSSLLQSTLCDLPGVVPRCWPLGSNTPSTQSLDRFLCARQAW